MLKKTFVLIFGCALSLGASSCQKLKTPGSLTFTDAVVGDAVPLDHGELIAVIPDPGDARVATLWFRRADEAIIVMWVNIAEGRLGNQILTIPRK